MKNVFTIAPDAPFLIRWRMNVGARRGRRVGPVAKSDFAADTARLPSSWRCFRAHRRRQTSLLPRMRPLGDIDEDEMSFAEKQMPICRRR